MRLKNKLYIKTIAIFTLLLTLGIFLYSCKKPDKKVLFNLNGGSINGSQNSVEVVVKHGEKISSDKIPQPIKEKSRLLGWYNGENLFNFDAEKIEKDITLLAKWQEQVKLTLPESVKSNAKDNDKIDKDTEIELEYIPQAGKVLKSFKVNGEEKVQSLVENKLKFKITQDTTVEIEQEMSKDAKYQADVETEFNKIDKLVKNGVIELVEDITKEKVLEKISSIVDVAKVDVNITEIEAGKKYEIELTHKEKNTIKNKKQYEFKKVEDLTNYLTDLDQEFEKIENAKVSGEIEINEEITKESVKARINQIIDESVVDVNITEVVLGKEYKVELVHKENNKAKKEQNVVFKKALQKYELTLTSDFEVVEPAGLNLSEVLKGTKIKVRVKTPEHKDIKEITKNNIPVLGSEIINNEYEFTMTQNITLKVSFKVKQEYINNLENEFNKLTNVRVIAPNGDIQEEKVKEKVLELVDGSIVSDVVVVKKGDKFEITLTHKLSDEAKVAKEILVLPEQVSITIDLQGKAKYNNSDKPVLKVNKGSKLVLENLPKANELVYTDNHAVLKAWSTDASGATPFPFNKVMKDDETIYAQYEIGYTVKFNVEEDVIDKQNYDGFVARVVKGEKLANPFAKPIVLPGYKFLKWVDKNDNSEFKFDETVVTKDIELKALFETETYLKYEKVDDSSNNVRITGIRRYSGDNNIVDVYIPETLKVGGQTYTIVAIGDGAFFKNQDIKTVTILGNKLEEIHHSAFSYSFIEKITLPESLKVISNFAFYESYLKKVTIPASVNVIGHRAFATAELEEVVFQNPNFRNINKNQFENSKWLANGIKNDNNAMVVNGVLIYVDKTKSDDMVVPNGVKKLGEWVFSDHKVSHLTLNPDLEEIANYAFYMAVYENGSTMTIPKSVKYIGFRAFAYIGKHASNIYVDKFDFEEGSKLEYIRGEAFLETTIKEVVLPEGLTEIGDYAFNGSLYLKKITFPSTLVKFGFNALNGTEWYKDQTNTSHFVVANDTLLDASRMTAADKLPNVKRIAKGALLNISGVQELTIPESVEYIYSYAMYKNKIIKTLRIPGTVKVIEKNAFIFETYYREGLFDQIHLDVMVSDVENTPTTWDNNWYEIRENDAYKSAFYTFKWAYKNKVLFDLDGGNVAGNINPQVLNKGDVATEPSIVPTKDGKVFVGWFLDDAKYDFTTPVNKSITLKARYVDINNDYDLAYENNELVFVRLKNTSLQEFTIPADVNGAKITRIKKDAFKNNTTVKKVVIPDSVKAIEDDAFNGDTNLSDITFGSGVKEFGKDFIKDTKWLSEKQASDKAVVINKVLVDAKNLEENAELSNEIEKISKYAFSQNTTTKVLTIKEGTTTIEGNAFKGNTSIEKIVLPNTLLYAKKDAFAIGRSGSVEIDATQVSHQRPRTWEDGYDNGDGATLTFKWKQVTTHKINLLDGITLTDPNLYPDAIVEGSVVEIEVKNKEYYNITKFTVNGEDKLAQLKAGNNKLSITVNSNINFELEYDLIDDIKNEFMNEFNKLQDEIGYVIKEGDITVDGKNHIAKFVDTEIVDIEVIPAGSKYNIKFTSKKVPSYSMLKENVEFIPVSKNLNPSSFKVTVSNSANYSEDGENAFDGSYSSKWCDNKSNNKWIEADFNTELFVAQINIAHAKMGGEASSMNTRKYTIWYAGEDHIFHKWYTETNNRKDYSEHGFAGKKIRYLKMTVEQGEQAGNGPSRIYEIEVFSKTELVRATFELKGGTVNGSSDDVIKNLPKGLLLEEGTMPKVVKKNYIVEKWINKATNEEVRYGQTRINGDATYYPVYMPDPEVRAKLRENINKVNEVEFVIKETDEILTMEEIKAHVEKIVSAEYLAELQLLMGDMWRLTLKLREDENIQISKNVEFIKKKAGETVKVTYDLSGGTYNGSADNVVYNIEKGSMIADTQIPEYSKLKKSGDVFVDWFLESDSINPEGYLLKKDVTFTAKWAKKPASGSNLHDYIKDAEITKGFINSYWGQHPLGEAYDVNGDGTPNKDTYTSIEWSGNQAEVEIKFRFRQEVEINKIEVTLMGILGSWMTDYNLGNIEFYGSYDGKKYEKIGEMINIKPNKNIVEVITTSKKPIRYLKLYSNMSQEKQGRYLTAFELVDVSFFAV